MKIKGISWIGIGTDDFKEALAFFADTLGLATAVVDSGGVAMLRAGDQIVEIFGPGTRGRERTMPPAIAFEVEDVAQARDELRSKEVEIIGEIGTWDGFEWLYFRGPDRYIYAVKKTPPPGWET